MDRQQKALVITHLDIKLNQLQTASLIAVPKKGWINSIRTSINMTLKQLGNRMSITAQSVKEIEDREAQGTITIKNLSEVANALDLKLVYGFVSKHGSIEKMIENRAQELAKEIVLRTSEHMELEDQKVDSKVLKEHIDIKTEEIKSDIPKYLWD